jgi:hypothetical protein
MRNGSERLRKRLFFCVKNGSATRREEGFAKQTQVMLLGKWSAEDVVLSHFEIGVKLEPWLRRYS